MLIQADNISLKRDNKKILESVNLTLKAQEIITIIGPNGAGKSSLVKILLGLDKPSEGKVFYQKGIKVAYTPQTFQPNPYIPIKVINFLTLNQDPPAGFLADISQKTKVVHLLGQSLHSLSGGERQKVLLARALLQNPDVLILDEPAQNLDINGQMELYQLIKEVNQNTGCAILMVSHDLHWVMRDSNQVLCLHRHVCCLGKPSDVLKDEQFRALFGEQMAELTAIYQHHHDHNHQ